MTINATLPTPAATTPEAQPLRLPPVPAPRDRDVRWELAAALRQFGRLGFEFGFNGHVSARAPEAPGNYWVNPFGVSFDAVRPSDFVLVDGEGDVVEPRGNASINGFSGNLELHKTIPDAAVVVHVHSPQGFIWSSLGRPLEAVNTDAALVVGLQGLSRKIWGEPEQRRTNVELAREGARVILQDGHGFVTWGESVAEAAFYLWAAERAASSNVALLGHPEAHRLPSEAVELWTLTPDLARAHFEPAFTIAEAQGLR